MARFSRRRSFFIISNEWPDTRPRLVLGQLQGAEKSNEIIVITNLLRMLVMEGAIVTIDAMG